MPLNKQKLKQDLKDLRNYMKTINDPSIADEEYAERLSTIIYDFVKSAKVTVIAQTGQIMVQGTATQQANVSPITIVGQPEQAGLS